MEIIVKFEVDNDLTKEEIEKDLLMGESDIGWNYDYKIISVTVKETTK